jgi:hypothetical protein
MDSLDSQGLWGGVLQDIVWLESNRTLGGVNTSAMKFKYILNEYIYKIGNTRN